MTEQIKLKGRVRESTLRAILSNLPERHSQVGNTVVYWTGKNLFEAVRHDVMKWDVFLVLGRV